MADKGVGGGGVIERIVLWTLITVNVNRAKQIISVLPEQYFLGRSVVQTW